MPVTTSISRSFHDLPEDRIQDGDQPGLLAGLGWSDATGWPELLASPRVIIISEAGAGKTYECENQQARLWEQGEPAFFLDLAQLANGDLRAMLMPEQEERLDAWLVAQSDTATFFLDSYDELKLSLGSFRQALTALAKTIRGNLGRVRIVMTTRPIPFDQQLMRQLLPMPDTNDAPTGPEAFADIAMGEHRESNAKKEKTPPIWRTVALMPLSDMQIVAMAKMKDVSDPEALLADVRRRHAQEFARRPQDLIELCADWNAEKRIRTHREQVAANVAVKLKPRTDRDKPEKAPLSQDRAIEGASRLALAMLLTRKLTLRHNAESDKIAGLESALDPSVILTDWTSVERETLLERPLFGFATYGRVRFHHRSVLEYLAAERLRHQVDAGMPMKALKRLLFTQTHQGAKVVRPSMRPVVGWLAGSIASIFTDARRSNPEVLLDHGDPESLPIDQRCAALRAYVERYRAGNWRGMDVPHIQVHRFADPALAPEINALWSEGIENVEVRSLILSMVEAGQLVECADIAFAVATDVAVSSRERIDALDAMIAIEDIRLPTISAAIVADDEQWPEPVARSAIMRLFPDHMTVAQFCVALARVQPRRRTVGDIDWQLPRLIAERSFTQEALESLREGLAALVSEDLAWNASIRRIKTPRGFLADGLMMACLTLLQKGDRSPGLLHSVALALRLASDRDNSEKVSKRLRSYIGKADADVRAGVFWADDALMQQINPQTAFDKRYFEPVYRGSIQVDYEKDAGWVRAALEDRQRTTSERSVALEILMRIGTPDTDWRTNIEALRPAVVDVPELRALIDQRLLPLPMDEETRRIEAQIAASEKKAKRKRAKDRASWVSFWNEIAEHPDELFDPAKAENTVWNLWKVMPREGDHSRASGWNRLFLEQQFGTAVADRMRATLIPWWRKQTITLPSERPPKKRNNGYLHWELAVAAIAAEAEDADWAKNLTSDEAKLAAKFAPVELNRFPLWFDALAIAHPAAVDATLGEELLRDLNRPAVTGEWSSLLQNIPHASANVAAIFVPRLATWLTSTKGRVGPSEDAGVASDRIARVVALLLKYGQSVDCQTVRTIAIDELSDSPPMARVFAWLPVLMRIDPTAGVDRLEALFASTPVEACGDAVIMFGNLFGDRHSEAALNPKDDKFTPDLLLRLTLFAYRQVRSEDDAKHEGAHSVGPREHAEHARNAVLSALLDTAGPAGWAAKLTLASHPAFDYLRDRVIKLAEEKAAEEAEGPAFTDAQTVAIDLTGEASPATTEAMFALLCDRLDDIDDLLMSDVTPREAWAAITDERVMRREIARVLRDGSKGAYTVDQEAVTADEKETDIRFRVAATGQQAVIELKIGDKPRSGSELRDTIRNQLLNKYMAPQDCRAGCLLITLGKDRSWKHPDTGAALTLAELIALLNEEAVTIMNEMGGSVRIMVKAFDLRPRLATEKETKALAQSNVG